MEWSDPSCGSLSEDLWIEIFKRSSVKSVCALRCVCKWWNSLISSEYFINLHHTFNLSSKPDNLKTYIRANTWWIQADYSLFGPNLSTHPLHFPFKSLARSISCGLEKKINFVDVIHGIVCLSYGVISSFDSTLLWNPGIHKYVALPFLSFPYSSKYLNLNYSNHHLNLDEHYFHQIRFLNSRIGFGYDKSKNDFKVVRIWMPYGHIRKWRPYLKLTYDVYSSRRGLWKSGMLPDHLQSLEPLTTTRCFRGYFLNGSIYWFIKCGLLMFDCEREEFKTMELPQEVQDAHSVYWPMGFQLLSYGGMLAAWLPSTSDDDDTNMAEFWVMEENGTWKKLYKIAMSSSELELNDIHVCQPSFVINPSHQCILDEWSRFHPFNYVSRAYEQTLLLMDHPNVQSYTEEESDDYTDDGETDVDESTDDEKTDLDESTDDEETDTDEDSDIVDDHTNEDTEDS